MLKSNPLSCRHEQFLTLVTSNCSELLHNSKKGDPMKSSKKITRSEEEVLTTLWNAGVPLSSSQIVNAAENCSWKPSYTHLLLNSLLKKELIRVAGFQQSATNYARVFEPTITQEEYTSFLLSRQKPTSSTLTSIFSTLISQETDPSTIDELELLLKKRKIELEEKSKE